MKLTKSCYLVAFFGAWLLLLGCADGREQYRSKTVSPSERNGSPVIESLSLLEDIFERPESKRGSEHKLKDLSRAELSERTRQNSLKPIIYARGAAGIDFNTTLEEASSKLETDVGPLEDGRHGFHEEIIVRWNQNSPRTPEMIVVDREYLGALEVPASVGGSLRLQQELSEHFPEFDPNGEEFLKALYNFFEKKEPGYDCLLNRRCRVQVGSERIVFYLPGLRMFFTRDDRNSLIQLWVIPGMDPLLLAGQFDLIEGKIFTEGGRASVELGMSFEQVRDRSGIQGEVHRLKRADGLRDPEAYDRYTVLFDGFRQDYDGLVLVYDKTKYHRDYQLPEGNEKLKLIRFGAGLAGHQILLAGEPAWVILGADESIKIQLGERPASATMIGEDLVFALSHQMPQLRSKAKAQRNLMRELVKVTEDILSRNPNISHTSRVIGHHDDRKNESMRAFVHALNSDPNQPARTYTFTSNFKGFNLSTEVLAQTSPFAKMILSSQGVRLGSRELLGLKLGQLVRLENRDAGKAEADLYLEDRLRSRNSKSRKLETVEDSSLSGGSGRVVVSEHQTASIFELVGIKPVRTWMEVNLISFFINGLEIQTQKRPGSGNSEVIVSIAGSPNGEIVGLCGRESLKTRLGESVVSLLRKLKGLKSGVDSKPCVFQKNLSGDSDGRVTSVDFPGEGVTILFSRNEVSALRIYSNREQGVRSLGGELK